jgi:hypothetical protein
MSSDQSNTPDMNNLEVPPIPSALINWLQKHFPAKDFKVTDDLRTIDRYGGTRDLIKLLQIHHDLQFKPNQE